jgi:replicative DNA helicase
MGELSSFDVMPPEAVDRLVAWCCLKYPGRRRDAAIGVLRDKNGIPPEHGAWLVDRALERAQRWTRADAEALADEAEGWDRPVPLSAVPSLPAFPAGVFPPWLEAEVAALAESAQVPRCLPAMVALGVLAAACGGRAVTEIKPGWREPLNLYVVPAMSSGTRKSPVYAPMVAPLLAAEKTLASQARTAITEARTARAVADKAAAKAEREAAEAAADPDRSEEDKKKAADAATAAALLAEAIMVPVVPRMLADDVTPEKLAAIMAEQGGRMAILSSEGGPLVSLAGRYSTSKEPNLDAWLKGHNGLHEEIRVDRVGRAPDYVQRPALTVCVTVQPGVLRRMYQIPQLRDRGLLARFLYAMPPDLVGYRKVRTVPVPAEVAAGYASGMTGVVNAFAGWDDPAVLQLSPGALEMLTRDAEALEPRLRLEADLGHIRDWAGKRCGAVARVAGLLHAAEHGGSAHRWQVGEQAMGHAIAVGEYLTAHALTVFGYMGADPVVEDARAVFEWLRRDRRTQFTRRDLHRALQARFKKAEDLDPALTMLDGSGWIKQARAPVPGKQGGRPPSPVFTVHPAVLRC